MASAAITVRSAIFGDPARYDIAAVRPGEPCPQGCFTKPQAVFRHLLQHASRPPDLLLEVGSWYGDSAAALCRTMEELYPDHDWHLVCVDTWLGSIEHWQRPENPAHDLQWRLGRPGIYEVFVQRMVNDGFQERVTPLAMPSATALRFLEVQGLRFDFAYIDAAHDLRGCHADITGALRVLQPGAIMMGDDYFDPRFQVAAAVQMAAAETGARVALFNSNFWAMQPLSDAHGAQ